MKAYAGQTVWIVGAGDGIGRALATELHARGARLILSGRKETSLHAANDALGGLHAVLPLDVANPDSVASAVRQADQSGLLAKHVVLLAGLYQPMTLETLELGAVRDIVETNLLGAFHAVSAFVPYLRRQGGGQFALCASLSAYRGLPKSQPYGATKAGIVSLAESLRTEMRGSGIDVRLISPGFVRTRLTDKNNFKMPALLEPTAAARRIADGLSGGRFEIHFPRRLSWPLKLLSALPRNLLYAMVRP